MKKAEKLFDYVREDGEPCPICGHTIYNMKCTYCGYPNNPVDIDGDDIIPNN